MSTIYMENTGGNAANSGCTDNSSPDQSGSAATSSGTTVTLDGSPDLSALITAAGDAQSTIAFAATGVSNRKIFKITAFDNTAKTVTVDQAPALSGSQSWRIGGRLTPAGFNGFELGAGAGDRIIINEDLSSSSPLFSVRGAGDSTLGRLRVIGKAGAYRVLTNTTTSGSASIITESGTTSGHYFENLQFDSDGTSGSCLAIETAGIIYNCRFVDGATGVTIGASGFQILGCEFTGLTTAINMGSFSGVVWGCYIHHNQDGIVFGGNSTGLLGFNIITKNTQYGIHITSGPGAFTAALGHIVNNTIAWNGADGIRITDLDINYFIANNIFAFNGTTSGYNLNATPGTGLTRAANMFNNLYYATGGGTNVNNHTLTATEVNADPLFTNADASNDDYSLQSGSPAKAAAFLLFGFGTYLDLGAIQRQEAGGGGGGTTIIQPGNMRGNFIN